MSYLSQNPLIIVAILTILLSPFVIKLASDQNKKSKQNIKYFFIIILFVQILLGFLGSFNLGIFFAISIIQIILLALIKKFYTLVVILNFVNTFIFFYGMIRLGQTTGIQDTSFVNIANAFIILIGNVIGLILINKDKNLLKKYFRR